MSLTTFRHQGVDITIDSAALLSDDAIFIDGVEHRISPACDGLGVLIDEASGVYTGALQTMGAPDPRFVESCGLLFCHTCDRVIRRLPGAPQNSFRAHDHFEHREVPFADSFGVEDGDSSIVQPGREAPLVVFHE